MMTLAHRRFDRATGLRVGSMAVLLSLALLAVFVVPFTIVATSVGATRPRSTY